MTERELVRCLSDPKEENDAVIRRWIDATPDEEVTKTLRSIASRALGNPAQRYLLLASVIVQLFALAIGIINKVPVMTLLPQLVVLFAQIPVCLIWIDQGRLRKGRRAVLYLAEHDPVQSIALLVLCFQRRRDSDTVWNAKIEVTLTDVLDKSLESTEAAWDQPRLYELLEGIAGTAPLHKAAADMGIRRAYLIIAAIRLLARVGGWKNRGLLQSIAKQPAPDDVRFPNRRLIYDCSVHCLAPPLVSPVTGTPTTALSSSTAASATPEPRRQVV